MLISSTVQQHFRVQTRRVDSPHVCAHTGRDGAIYDSDRN